MKYQGDIVIPASITYNEKSYIVSTISYGAFRGCTGLTSIVIPNSVTEIGGYAFNDCTGLTSIYIPSSVLHIGRNAFDGCHALKDVIIEDGDNPLELGWSYAKIDFYVRWEADFPSSSKSYYKVNESSRGIFSDCSLRNVYIGRNLNFKSHTGEEDDYQVPKGDESYVFGSYIRDFSIPPFMNYKEEFSVTFSDRLTSIDSELFKGCAGLTSIDIPESVTSIGIDAFADCTGLVSVEIPNAVTYLSGFSGCTGLTSIVIPNSVTKIGKSAFQGCTGLTSIDIPNSVTEIGESAFQGCTGLISIDISNSVTEIGERAFYGCTDLTSIDIPYSVTEIGK